MIPTIKFTLLSFLPIALCLIVLAYTKNSSKPLAGALILFVAYAFDLLCRNLPHLLSFEHKIGHWNWEGGILSFMWPWFTIFFFEFFTPQEVGLTLPTAYKGLFFGLLFGAILGGLNVLSGYFFTGLPSEHLFESAAYQALIPALSEELVYRGIFLAILTYYLRGSVFFNWGIVLVSILFISNHLISTDKLTGKIVWVANAEGVINITITTIILAYLRISTDSIWPCMICHSLTNVLPFAASILLKA